MLIDHAHSYCFLGPKFTYKFDKKHYNSMLELTRKVISPNETNANKSSQISGLDTKQFELYCSPMPSLLQFKSIFWNLIEGKGNQISMSPQVLDVEIEYNETIEKEIDIYLIGKKSDYPPEVLEKEENQLELDKEIESKL
jgi:hypothetical protein